MGHISKYYTRNYFFWRSTARIYLFPILAVQVFLRNSLLFLCCILVVFMSVYGYHKIKLNTKFETIATNYSYLIMGDSQTQRLSEDVFDKKTFNFSNTAEHYCFTYYKLKQLFSQETCNTKLILLGVSVHNFSSIYHKLLDLDKEEGLSSLKNFVYYLDMFDNEVFSFYDIISRKQFYQGVLKGPLKNRVIRSSMKEPKKEDVLKAIEMHFSKDGLDKTVDNQIYFLRKIVDLCKENKVDVFFISTPVHHQYKENIPQKELEKFYQIVQKFDVHQINYLDSVVPDSLMSDGNHLNIQGANYYGGLISQEILEN